MDSHDFLDRIADYTEQTRVDTRAGSRKNRLATVKTAPSSGLVGVQFDGDENQSGGGFAYLASYTPSVNDRVLMVPVGNSYVIQGKLSTSA
jgi:hypothetical protein